MSSDFQYESTCSSIAGNFGDGATESSELWRGYDMRLQWYVGANNLHEDDLTAAVPPRLCTRRHTTRIAVTGLPVRFYRRPLPRRS
ncbi:hypothetical protein GCM10007394_05250 [Salinibacterium amurskyense]|nr:hypothetical protein GCM10007394_05250 [Salinibacterium amurskyense]